MKQFYTLIFGIVVFGSMYGQTETKITASDGAAGDHYGWSASIVGDRAIVGAISDDDNGASSGSAYIYDWDGTNWVETKLTASDGATNDYYGYSVSIDGNRAIIGAYLDDDNGNNSGSVYIYDWDGSNWVETKLIASDGAANDNYGFSVSIEGDNVLVGAPYDDDNGSSSGSVYIYNWDGNNWIETKLTGSNAYFLSQFGCSTAISGNHVIIGARGQDTTNGVGPGAAYIYEWDGTNWIEFELLASDRSNADYYGIAVSIDGSHAVVGAYYDDDNGVNSGSVYIYEWDGSSWVETKLTASDGAAYDNYGFSVSIEGDNVLVGANNDDDNGVNSGSIYNYEWDGSTWVETKLTASDGTTEDDYGYSVSIDGERAIAGAYLNDDNGSNSGSVYIYEPPLCSTGTTINSYNNTGTGLWTDASNWSLNEVPAQCHDVVIPAGAVVTILSVDTAQCYTIQVDHTAELIVEQGAVLDVITDNN